MAKRSKALRKRRARQRHTPLAAHKQVGKVLKSKLSDAPTKIVDWDRDLLPEHLWIACLADYYGLSEFCRFFEKMMQCLDAYCSVDAKTNVPALGFVTDFGLVPEGARDTFWNENERLIEECFHKPFARVLSLYPDSPASWLVRKEWIEGDRPLDPKVEMERLSGIVRDMYGAKETRTSRLRMAAFTRLMAHGKFRTFEKRFGEVMSRYPESCSDAEMHYVESYGRNLINMNVMICPRYNEMEWPKYFWRHNVNLAPCVHGHFAVVGSAPADEADAKGISEGLQKNAEILVKYVESLGKELKYDLYAPERGEILAGLFCRVVRLFLLFSTEPVLWARDMAGIVLRCMADAAITFAYLSKKGSDEEVHEFKEYGEGQEKLLMLHLQDHYEGEVSLEGRDVDAISEALGSFMPELLDINLAGWSKKSARDMAIDAGVERIYRLVFSPTSSDIHGTWMSLKQSTVVWCKEPLHRFHRVPSIVEPPLFIQTLMAGQSVVEQCIEVGVESLGYPRLKHRLGRMVPKRKKSDALAEGR